MLWSFPQDVRGPRRRDQRVQSLGPATAIGSNGEFGARARAMCIRRRRSDGRPWFGGKVGIVGYQGESSRSISQRHSPALGNANHTLTPKCARKMRDRGVGCNHEVKLAHHGRCVEQTIAP